MYRSGSPGGGRWARYAPGESVRVRAAAGTPSASATNAQPSSMYRTTDSTVFGFSDRGLVPH